MYYDGTTWQSLKGADGSGGLSESEVNALIDAALDPYLLISDFNNIIANYATLADLANYMTVAQADGRYVRLQPGGVTQRIFGPIDVVGDLDQGRTHRLYENATAKSGPKLDITANAMQGVGDNIARIQSSNTSGATHHLWLEASGASSQIQLGPWSQTNDANLFILTRYIQFTQGLLNSGVPATCRMDTQTGQMWAGDFIAERGVETLRGENILRGASYLGVEQNTTTSTAKFVVTAAATPNTRIRGTGLEISAVLQNFTNAQQPLHRRATDNLVGYFSSSRVFKANIRPADDLADKTLLVEPVHFLFNEELYEKEDPHYDQMGFIAEDVVANYGPGAGVYGEDGKTVVDYSERPILAGLVALCQRQEAQINALTERIAALEGTATVAAADATVAEATPTTTTTAKRDRRKR
jgi:hypothetical protein